MKITKIVVWFGLCSALTSLWGAAPAAVPTERIVTISVPRQVAVAANFSCVISAETRAVGAEQIGFLHAEYTEDNGQTWQSLFYGDNLGRAFKRTIGLKAGVAGRMIAIRVRTAFRGGPAGDVDYAGRDIDWDNSWANWAEPPTKTALVKVVVR